MFKEKKEFIKDLSEVLSKHFGTIKKIEYRVFRNKKNRSTTKEFIVLTYTNGRFASRECSCDSKGIIYSKLGKLLVDGFDDNNIHYEKILNSKEWEALVEKPKFKFKFGDLVRVVSKGYTYNCYEQWFGITNNHDLRKKWKYGELPKETSGYVVVARSTHPEDIFEKIYAIQYGSEQVYLISEEGLEKDE